MEWTSTYPCVECYWTTMKQHWYFSIDLAAECCLVLMRSKSCLLIWPISAFAGLIRRHVGLMAKLGLWSLRVMNASRFAVVLIISSRCSFISTLDSSSMVLLVTWLGDFFCRSWWCFFGADHIERNISSYWEKYFVICRPEPVTLNKRNELVTSCRHAKKFLLKNFKPTIATL